MVITLTINATVVDLRTDKPHPTDVFLVDTNIWYWFTYLRASQAPNPPYQPKIYAPYINKVLGQNAKLLVTSLSFAEICSAIENTEWEIFKAQNNSPTLPKKEFRHNFPAERAKVIAQIQSAWQQVNGLVKGQILEAQIDTPALNSSNQLLTTSKIDGYDAFLLHTMQSHGIKQIITDDGDFATVPNIEVFTANGNVINSAKLQNKLKIR
jgi:predicted nucleic acid-binding protein